MASSLYFGPFNDPGNSQNKHHWDLDHDSDCHNPAIAIDRIPNSWTINVTVFLRNRLPSLSPDDIYVTLYMAACGVFNTLPEVEDAVGRLVAGEGGVTPKGQWNPELSTTPVVPPYNQGLDLRWQSPKVAWDVQPYASSILVVATVQTTQGQQAPQGPNFTKHPCVAVWLG